MKFTRDAHRTGELEAAARAHARAADGDRALEQVAAYWRRIRGEMGRDSPFSERPRFLAPSERRAFESMSSDDVDRAARTGRLGIPFFNPAQPLTAFEVVRVALEDDGAHGRAVATTGSWTISFPILREDGAWYAALGPREVEPRAVEDGDETGWLNDWYYGRGDLATRVSGGPGLTAAERHALIEAVRDRWIEGGRDVVPVTPTGTPSEFRVYHLHLDDARTGRLVLSDGRSTIVVGATKTGDAWTVGDRVLESRAGPAGPDDRDGDLSR
jgi:hypothetical protein